MNKQTTKIILLVGIILLGGFFNKIIPLNITILLVLIFISINITKKPEKNNIFYIFSIFSLFFLLTPFYYTPIDIKFIGYSLHGSTNNFNSFAEFIRIFGYLLFAYAISIFPIETKHYTYIWNSLIVTSIFVSLFCILEYYYGIKLYDQKKVDIVMQGVFRVRGPFGDPNASAGMIIPGMIILFSHILYKQKNMIFSLIIIIFLFIGMATTSSRTALLALFSSLLLFLFLKPHIVSTWKKSIVLIFLAMVGSSAIVFYLKDRELSFGSDASANVRLSLVESGINLILEHPILGHGLNGGFHNIFIDIGVSGGITLLGLFISLLFLILKYLWKQKEQLNAYILLSMLISFIVVGLGISWLNNVIFWTLIGLGMNKFYKNEERKC